MSVVQEAVTLDREICVRNPDPPGESYSYSYYLRSQEGDWSEFLNRLGQLRPDQVVVVAEKSLPASLRKSVVERLRTRFSTTILTFGRREGGKNLLTVRSLLDEAMAAGVTRSSVIVALGGGLAGNVAGLVAGLCLRGLPLVHIPTTLLAQSDSVLSLKQGVNGKLGKNHVGIFKAPAFVWSHLSFLASLPQREIQAALCEAIKNALIVTPDRILDLLAILRPQAAYTPEQFTHLIEWCIEAKLAVMENDAFEKHQAVVLEYGHSVGHAVELLARGTLTHGEAVGIGIVVEGDIAHRIGLLSTEDLDMHYALLRANGTPTTIPATLGTERILEVMRQDNKRGYLLPKAEHFDLVLLRALGKPNRTEGTVLTQVAERNVRAALNRCRA